MSRELARPLLPLLALGLWMAFRSPAAPPEARHQASLSTAIVKTLARQGWIGEAREVKWVDRPFAGPTSVWAGPRAVLRAHRIDEPADVLLLRTRVSPEGRFLAIARIDNLSDTAAVDEGQVQVSGNKVAWTVSVGDEITAIHTADLNGASLPQSADLGWVARLQIHLTWLQETGQFSGIEKREYRIDPPAKQVRLSYSGDDVVGQIDDLPFQLTPTEIRPNSGRIAQNPLFYGHPGNLVTWVVDRVRALPWIGNDRMQLAKTLAFDAIDRFERLRGRMTRDNGLSSLNDEVGHVLDSASDDPTDPETGWPPPPMTPVLKEPIPHEGHWVELNKDPFVATQVGIPAPFLFSFIRTDRERTYTKVFVILWDPRHVELHTMSGTREPKTATGETGTGQVPRDPTVLSHFIGAFNGGFQASHGEFGMMADSVLYLPPKPYAATVARLVDGSTGFGTWPNDATIPDSITSFRQNLTPLVMDDKENPYHRTWWGGVPPGWEDATRTVRTGICLTRDGFVGYFYGSSIDSTHLATAMRSALCQYGLQLDMNPGHTGFEFYRIDRKGKLPDLGRKLEAQWEMKGPVAGAPDWEFMGRRMIRYMNLMHFPRYVRTESRDFFYLTERRLLPLPPLEVRVTPREANEGIWQTKGLPQQGWPPAIATTRYRPDPSRPNTRVAIFAVDFAWLQVAKGTDHNTPGLVTFEPNEPNSKSTSLWFWNGKLHVQDSSPGPDARRLVSGTSEISQVSRAAAALGQLDGQIWVYVEVTASPDPARDLPLFNEVLSKLGASKRLFFGHPLSIKIGGPALASPTATRFIRQDGPRGLRIFPQTPIVAPSEWMPLQEKRLRYVKQPKTVRLAAEDSAGAETASGPEKTERQPEPAESEAP